MTTEVEYHGHQHGNEGGVLGQVLDGNLYSYRHFRGLWQDVDNGNLENVANFSLLSEQIDLKQQNVTPLFLACQRKDPSMIHFLLQSGANPDIECKGVTPLYLCTLYSEEESVKYLLRFNANASTLCTSRRISALHLAASKGLVTIANEIIKAGADVNSFSPRYGTPLHIAVAKNHQNILKLLLENGASASVNVQKNDGDTPLHTACRCGFYNLVTILISKENINPWIKDSVDGNTCLHLACMSNQTPMALLLISKFPDLIHVKNDVDRQTPLFYANENTRKAIKSSFSSLSQMNTNLSAVNNKTFSDLKYVFSNSKETIWGHKAIISLRCPKLLPGEEENEMLISDVEPHVFIGLLGYIYTDKISNDKAVLTKLIPVADRFGLLRLKKLCVDATTNIPVVIPDSSFQKDMRGAVNNPNYSDVILIVEDQKIFCHRVILSQHQYFKTMLGAGSTKMKESSLAEIKIEEVSYDAFLALLHYCYTWDIADLNPDSVIELFQCADLFLLEGLRHTCESYICKFISKDSACELFVLAETYKSLFLKEACFDFIVDHYEKLSKTKEFSEMKDELKDEIDNYMNKKSNNSFKSMAVVPRDTNYSLLY
eukprot:TRINITY_DN6632_c0_g1_i1.p1 TRINITY_DN6632_c0_g1~~TRINITY_DN6632_c0_g1_i1.p1  ORF type:complete len:601 (-),score=154.37 TRINITY_DN6632_c0_g1_i1:89-1891(-)